MLQLPLAPSPLSLSLSPFDIDYRKSISAACHMLICPVYGPTSFVRTFFVLSLLGRTGCLFMPFNKFTLPAAVPNTAIAAAVPPVHANKCNFKLPYTTSHAFEISHAPSTPVKSLQFQLQTQELNAVEDFI